jgi:hypothetical protein
MSQNRPQADPHAQRPYHVAPHLRTQFNRRQGRLAQLMDRHNPRLSRAWLHSLRARSRSLIRGDLITHRRMFGVSHKHVQPGEVPAERFE